MDWDPDTELTAADPVITHISSHESVATAIVSAVTEARECDIDAFKPVDEAIDLDAFDNLYTNSKDLGRADLQVTFTVAECKVILYEDGRVVVVPPVDRQSL